ncbi:hypothetical protein BCR35DRAFT_354577 [Leucosporidium creatinivorum]|uniref:Uncharacterized protein n=1 Tax=Leucosporidium creatinivorum TaxID=106004 RepID=A0A1Y2EGE8_9BASI|nr:hypothetical protein BCR35DRAFT_354577 [Leucosporidium creatinivorum]
MPSSSAPNSTSETSPPSLSSSLASLKSALTASDRASRLLLSPTSIATGDTGSTEEPYSATRELAESVAGHSSSAEEQQEFASAQGMRTPLRSSRELSPQLGSHAPSKVDFLSDSSWSQLGSPSPTPFPLLLRDQRGEEQSPFTSALGLDHCQQHLKQEEEDEHIYIKEEALSDDGRDLLGWSESPSAEVEAEHDIDEYCLPITSSQRDAADHILRSRRSQSDFSRWLEETMKMAKGDGGSVVDSEDALSSIAAVTRQARMGLSGGGGGTATSLTGTESGVVFDLGSEEGEEQLMDEQEPMWRSDTMPIKLEEEGETEASREGSAEQDEKVELAPMPVKEPSNTPSPAPSADRRWKLLSFALALGWLVSLVYPHTLQVIQAYLRSPSSASTETPIYSPPFANSSSPTLHLDDFSPPPLPLGPSTSHTLLTALFSLLLYGIYHLHNTRSSPNKRPLTRSRSPSPLLELNPSSITEARTLLPLAIAAYHSSNLTLAITHFTSITSLACAPADKATSAEWLGRALYRLARRTGEREEMEEACRAFERALRMNGGNATARASLGRAKWRLGEGREAIKQLRAAVKRDEQLAFAHEYLGKAYSSLCDTDDSISPDWILAEQHLRRTIALNPSTSYSALAFLGEQLHTRGRTVEARQLLEQAVGMRIDYSAAHARLAFIATEQMDQPRAAGCWRMVLASRESGFADEDLLPGTRVATQGPTPFLSLYFALSSAEPKERLDVLDRARKFYPSNTLLTILHSITQRQAHSAPISTSLDSLRQLEGMLARRVERFGDGAEGGDVEGKGLWALCLLGLNKGKMAEKVYGEFWGEMRERKGAAGSEERERELAFLVMAFYDLKGAKRGQARRRREL